jgi:excisionase family DNA binding protein
MRNSEGSEKKCRKKQEQSFSGEQLLTVEQVAHRLNVGVRTVWRLDAEKKIPASFQIGSRKRWDAQDLELWLQWKCPSQKKFNELKNERIGHDKKFNENKEG